MCCQRGRGEVKRPEEDRDTSQLEEEARRPQDPGHDADAWLARTLALVLLATVSWAMSKGWLW